MPSATNKYFDTPAEAPEHPKIRAWSAWKSGSQRVELEIRRPREGLAFLPTRMFVRYDRAAAERILTGALAQYLDERFHVTERRQLGFG